MRHITAAILVFVLAGCIDKSEQKAAANRPLPAAAVAATRVEPPQSWIGQAVPFVASTTAAKASWLKLAGIHADPLLLGTPYRLDETTPYVKDHGELYDIHSSDTSHFFGGFASLQTRQTLSWGTVIPGMIIHVRTDPSRNQLFDCYIAAEGWQMEFQTAEDWVWSKPPLTTSTVTVQSNHAFFVLPKDATKDWAFVRVMATLQNPIDQFWRFVGCDITPIN